MQSKPALARPGALPRVAFDTAVLLQALLSNQPSARALRLIKALSYPGFGLDAVQQRELLADFLPYAEVVRPALGGRVTSSWAPALKLAKAAQADLLVSESKQLGESFTRARLAYCQLLNSAEFLTAVLRPGA